MLGEGPVGFLELGWALSLKGARGSPLGGPSGWARSGGTVGARAGDLPALVGPYAEETEGGTRRHRIPESGFHVLELLRHQ